MLSCPLVGVDVVVAVDEDEVDVVDDVDVIDEVDDVLVEAHT